jgi:subtilisin family serine protease
LEKYLSSTCIVDDGGGEVKARLRAFGAFVLTVLMVVSFGAAPALAVGSTVVTDDFASFARSLSSTPVRADSVGTLDWFGPDSGFLRPISVASTGPVEVIIGLEGNSLAAEQAYRQQMGMPLLDGEAQSAYVASLRASQAPIRAALEAAGGSVLYDYQIAFNGIAASLDASQLATISTLSGVRDVQAPQLFTPALDKSVPFIFGGMTNAELGADGTGITIAIIDTGIDYTHAGLGGSGDPADFASNDPTIIEPGTFPTAKVVGGTDLVGEFYDAGAPPDPTPGVPSSIPFPDPDPLDQHGHGSHVAGIAAGVGTSSVSPGVAPGASLLAVKVFALGSSSSSVIMAAIEFALDPDQDGDTSDAVDVINMSLGAPYGRDTEVLSVASNAAVDLGVIVVASAGNEGDLPYVTGGPAAASKVISVAAGNDPGIAVQLLEVSGTDGADGAYEAIEAAFTPPLSGFGILSGPTVFVGLACDLPGGDNPFSAGELTGMIPLIVRGACRFDQKLQNVEEAGAIAAIVYNSQPGAGPIVMGGDPIVGIPGFMIGNVDGVTIAGALLSGSTFTLDPANTMPIPDRLTGFSSRGPRFVDSALKPDITAPGNSIASVFIGTGTEALSISGTSMSSPHIAGAAALLRQLHPDWSVEEIKAVLMNTATDASPDGLPYPVSRMGAGRVRVDVAADTESVVVPASASFGVEERDKQGKKKFEVKLEVRNKGDETKEFELSSAFLFPNDDEGSIQIKHPDKVRVEAGHSKKIKLQLRVDFDRLDPESSFEEYDGFLTLTETTDGGDVLRVPFHMIPIARARAEAEEHEVELPEDSTIMFRNKGLRGTLVDVYQFGVSDPNEDLIAEGLGFPNDPDDWFDVHRTGAHAFDVSFGRIIEFAVTTYGRRSVANFMLTEVYLDVDGDGVPDYLVQAADLGAFLGGFPDGRIVSALFELSSGFGFLEFFVADDMNTGIQTIPILMEDLNLLGFVFGAPTIDVSDPDFDYFVATLDFETGSFDVTESATFNAITPELDTFPNFFFLPAGAEVEVDVLASSEGGILALYLNNKAGKAQSEVIEVEID